MQKKKHLATNSKEFCKIVELSMNITTNGHRAFHRLQRRIMPNIQFLACYSWKDFLMH